MDTLLSMEEVPSAGKHLNSLIVRSSAFQIPARRPKVMFSLLPVCVSRRVTSLPFVTPPLTRCSIVILGQAPHGWCSPQSGTAALHEGAAISTA